MSSRQALNFILFRHIIDPKFIFLKQATPTNKMCNNLTHMTSSTTLKTRSTTFLKEAWCKVNNSILFQGFSAARSHSLKTDISPRHGVDVFHFKTYPASAISYFSSGHCSFFSMHQWVPLDLPYQSRRRWIACQNLPHQVHYVKSNPISVHIL